MGSRRATVTLPFEVVAGAAGSQGDLLVLGANSLGVFGDKKAGRRLWKWGVARRHASIWAA